MTKIAASILSADFANLKHDCTRLLEAGVDLMHFDVMDGHFVPNISYGAALGIMTYVFRVFSPYECAACCALLIVSSIPEWLDLISHRTERIRFMREEEQRLANSTKPE